MDPPVSIEDEAAPAVPVQKKRRLFPLFFALCVAVAIGAALFRLIGPKPAPPPAVVHYTPGQVRAAERHITTLREQLLPPVVPVTAKPLRHSEATPSQFPPAAPLSPSQDRVRLQLSQADLNAYLTTDPQMKALLDRKGVRAVQIVLQQPRGLVCRAAVLYRGHPANIQISGNLFPSATTVVRLETTSAQIGRLPLPPKTVTGQANQFAAALTARLHGRLPLTVENVQVIGDRLILTGHRSAPERAAKT